VSAILIIRIAVVVLCSAALIFFVRFLRGLAREARSLQPSTLKVYFARFIPCSKRGELIVMNPGSGKRQSAVTNGKRAGLVILVAAWLVLPTHAQQIGSRPEDRQASAGNDQIPPAVAKQLADMERRIEQLEAELKKQPSGTTAKDTASVEKATEPPAAAANGAAIAPTAPLVPAPAAAVPVASIPARAAAEPTTGAAPAAQKKEKAPPFGFADFTWLNGNSRVKDVPLDTKFFTPEIRSDVDYIEDFNHPADDSIGGSSEVFRANEFQLTQFGVGGDFHYSNVQARLMTQFGMYSETTPRNDASPARGQWDLDTAYRYVSEAYGGYHLNVMHGINIQAGIFMSYIGLFSYYNFDNWAYQPSYVSSNTPWFFNGMRVQIFPTEHLKIEPWFINGWQSYGRFNHRPGVGGQILWRPTGNWEILGNQYALGADTLGVPGRIRYHTDDSIEYKYYDHPENFISKAAFSVTGDAGCEHGGDPVAGTAVSCDTNGVKIVDGVKYVTPKQSFLGFMVYNRLWFHRDKYGFTLGGGKINNPGRYLVLLPPIDGATAITGTPYFPENPGDPFKAWDASATFDYMPMQYITFRWEYDHRAANVPYFSGRGGITPPGGNNGNPAAIVPGWAPDLVRDENRLDLAILVMF
jgi:Putative beta-barrel porin-2, OmpL-like. bbp2